MSELSGTTSANSEDNAVGPGKGKKKDKRNKLAATKLGKAVEQRSSPQLSLLEDAVLVKPIAVAKASAQGLHRDDFNRRCRPKRTMVSWIDFGPRCPPCIAMMFESSVSREKAGSLSSRIVLGTVKLPLYGYPLDSKESEQPLAITVLSQTTTRISQSRASLVGLSACCAFASHNDDRVQIISPSLSDTPRTCGQCPYFLSLARPVSSTCAGVDSLGMETSTVGHIYHVFTQLVSRRQERLVHESPGERLGFDHPVQRHWLCKYSIFLYFCRAAPPF